MDKESLAKQSPLSLLGLPDTGPDLLDEAMKGKVQAPGSSLASNGFGSAKETAFDTFKKALPIDLPESARQTIETKQEPEANEKQEEQPEQKQDLEEEAGAPESPEPKEELPSYFHSLNESHEQIRQRQDRIDQALRESQRREQAYIEQLRQAQQPAQPQQPAQNDYSWAEKGFESAEQYQSWQNAIRQEARQEALQIYQQQQAPIIQQMANDRFNVAISRCSKDYENFDTYFPRESLQSYYSHIVQKFGAQQAAQMDFEGEFTAAYKVREYDRMKALLAKEETKKTIEGQSHKEAKQERKAALALVPKANQAGTPVGKKTLEEELAEMGKPDIHGVARHLRSRLFAH